MVHVCTTKIKSGIEFHFRLKQMYIGKIKRLKINKRGNNYIYNKADV